MRRWLAALFAVTFLGVLALATTSASADDDCAHLTATIGDGLLTVTHTGDGPVTVNGVLIEPRYFHDDVGFVMPVDGFDVLTVASGECTIVLPTSSELDAEIPEYAPPPIVDRDTPRSHVPKSHRSTPTGQPTSTWRAAQRPHTTGHFESRCAREGQRLAARTSAPGVSRVLPTR